MAQFLRPDGNITVSQFTGGYVDIDETVASDTDFAYSGVNSDGILEVSLSNPASTPASGTTTVRYRIAKVTSAGALSGTGNSASVIVTVYQGTTLIATDTERTATGSFVNYSFTPDMSGVTDWNDLRLRFTIPSGGGGTPSNRRGVAISFAELEAPNGAGANTNSVADSASYSHSAQAAKDGIGSKGSPSTYSYSAQAASSGKSYTSVANSASYSYSAVAAKDSIGSSAAPSTYTQTAQAAKDHIASIGSPTTYSLTGVDANSSVNVSSGSGLNTLQDLFTGTSLDTGKWAVTTKGVGSTVTQNNKLIITQQTYTPGAVVEFTGVTSVNEYTLTSNRFYIEFTPPVTTVDDWGMLEMAFLVMNTTNDEGVGFSWTKNNGLAFRVWNDFDDYWTAADPATPITYSATNHAFLSLREDSGNIIWETAPKDAFGNPGTWTQQASVAHSGFSNFDSVATFLSNAKVRLASWVTNGGFDNSYLTTPASFDTANTTNPTAVNTDSVADPATYSQTAQAAVGLRGLLSVGSPASYSHSVVAAKNGIGSYAVIANYSLTSFDAVSGRSIFSVGSSATYGYTATSSTHHLESNGGSATYSFTGFSATSSVAIAPVNVNSVADPVTYSLIPSVATSTVQVTGVANSSSYLLSTFSATSGRNQFSVGSPATYSHIPTASKDGIGSLGLPSSYSYTALDTSGSIFANGASSADAATYSMADQSATSFVAKLTSALPASYSHTAQPTTHEINRASVASPAVYTTSAQAATSVATGSINSDAQSASYITSAQSSQEGIATGAASASYTYTGSDATSFKTLASVGTISVANPAAYGHTPQPTTSGRNINSSALAAVYTAVAVAAVSKRSVESQAFPTTYSMSATAFPTTDSTTGTEEGLIIPVTPVETVQELTDAEFLAWLKDPSAIRVVLMECQCLDENGNVKQLFFANRGYTSRPFDQVPNRAYLPFLKGGLDFEQTIGLDLGGSISYGDIELDNTEGDLDWALEASWQYQPVRAYVGDARWSRNNFRQIFDGVAEDLDTSQRDVVNVRLRDKLYRLDMPIHDQKIGGSSAESDSLLPVALGECHNVTPVLLDAQTLKYCYHTRVAESVFEVRDNGIPIQRVPQDGVAPATFTLLRQPAGRITCSVQGDAIGGYTNSISDIIYRLVTEWGTEVDKRFSETDIDLANFYQFAQNHPEPVGIYITDRMTVLEACQRIAASVGARLTVTYNGKLQLVQVAIPPVGTPTVITRSDMMAGSLSIKNRPVLRAAVKLGYCKNWTVQADTASGVPEEHKRLFAQEWLSVTAVNGDVRDRFELWGEPEPENTLLLDEDSASNEAFRRLVLRSTQRHVYEFTGFADLALTNVGSSMQITHDRFNLSQGKIGQVVAISVDWVNTRVRVQVVA